MFRKVRKSARVNRRTNLFDSIGQNILALEPRTMMAANLLLDINKTPDATLLFDSGETQFYQQGFSLVAVEDGLSKTILTDDRMDYDGRATHFQKADQTVLIRLENWESTSNYMYRPGDEAVSDLVTPNELIVNGGDVFEIDSGNDSPKELDLTTRKFKAIELPLADATMTKFVPLGQGQVMTEFKRADNTYAHYIYHADSHEFEVYTILDSNTDITDIKPVEGLGQAFLLADNKVYMTDGTDSGTFEVFSSFTYMDEIQAIPFGDGVLLACQIDHFVETDFSYVEHEYLFNVSLTNPTSPTVIFDSDRVGDDFPSGLSFGRARNVQLFESGGNILCAYGDHVESRLYELTADSTLVDLGSVGYLSTSISDGKGQFFFEDSQPDPNLLFHTTPNGLEQISAGSVLWNSHSQSHDILNFNNKFFYFNTKPDNTTSLYVTDGTPSGTFDLMTIESRIANVGYMEPAANFYNMTSHGLVFQGWDADHGTEPWISDGTQSGTHLLIDLVPGPSGSSAKGFTINTDGFSCVVRDADGLIRQVNYTWDANSVVSQVEMLQMMMGSWPYFPWNSSPVQFQGKTAFIADDGLHSRLYLTDGTAAGTTPVFAFSGGSYSNFIVSDDLLYFTNRKDDKTELWRSDGTVANTQLVTLLDGVDSVSLKRFVDNGKTYLVLDDFLYSSKRWLSDGTAEGTQELPLQFVVIDIVAGHVLTLDPQYMEDGYFRKLSSYDIAKGESAELSRADEMKYLGNFKGQAFLSRTSLALDSDTIFSTDGIVVNPTSLVLPSDAYYQGKSFDDHILLYPSETLDTSVSPVWYVQGSSDSEFKEFPIGDYLDSGIVDSDTIQDKGGYLYFTVKYSGDGSPYNEIWRSNGTLDGTKRLISGDLKPNTFEVLQVSDTAFISTVIDGETFGYQILPDGALVATELYDYLDEWSDNLIGVASGKVLFRYNDPLLGYEPYTLPIVTSSLTIDPISDVVIDVNKPWSLQVSAKGFENGLKYSLISGSESGVQIDSNTGLISWTPPENARGQSYHIVVQAVLASDSSLKAEQSIQITVNGVNSAPELAAIADQILSEGIAWTVQAQATDMDVPAQTFTFSLEGTVPDGLVIDPKTGQLQWTPTELQGGLAATITVKVADNGTTSLAATRSFKVTVNEVNSAPVVEAVAGQSVKEGELLALNIRASDPDAPAQNLTYSLVGNIPSGASIDPVTGLFQWKPAYKSSSATITVKVTDNGSNQASEQMQFQVTVKPNPIVPKISTVFDKRKQFSGLQLNFNDRVDATSSKKITAYRLVTAGRDKKFGTKDDKVVKLKSATLQSGNKSVLLSPKGMLSKTETYQLTVFDRVLDSYGRAMDGNKDGRFGGSAIFKITKGVIR